MSTLSIEQLKAINLFIVGWGTESAKGNPYALVDIYHQYQSTVAKYGEPEALRRWGVSGYTIGAMNFDFGQRGDDKVADTNKRYIDFYIDTVNAWGQLQPGSPQLTSTTAIKAALRSNVAEGIIQLGAADLALLDAFSASDTGKTFLHTYFDAPLLSENAAKAQAALALPAFATMSEADRLASAAMICKVYNQSQREYKR